jgi:CRISPR/Cas system-associated endonuclease Cas1
MGCRRGRIDAVFMERAGVTIVSRGGRLQSRYHGEYEEIDGDARVIVASGAGFVITSDAVRACTRKHIEIIITDGHNPSSRFMPPARREMRVVRAWRCACANSRRLSIQEKDC